jgi:hypothetical protein
MAVNPVTNEKARASYAREQEKKRNSKFESRDSDVQV